MRIEPPLERYAGTYPTSSDANDGLAVWTKANRTIANTDIVGWYTPGFHHITRAEDVESVIEDLTSYKNRNGAISSHWRRPSESIGGPAQAPPSRNPPSAPAQPRPEPRDTLLPERSASVEPESALAQNR